MGNQGMTNWKFSAFFAIALMLVAGLFSNAAIAADGGGKMSITAPSDVSDLEAGLTIDTMTFQYSGEGVGSKMAGGLVQMVIPSAWKLSTTTGSLGTVAATGLLSGSTDTTVRVQIPSDFADDGTIDITVTNITVPIPDKLTDGDRDDRYEEYEFTTSSRTRSGSLRKLNPIVETKNEVTDSTDYNGDGDQTDTAVVVVTVTQPLARVGNIGSAASGKVVIKTPKPNETKAYETYDDPTEGPTKFQILFTADGPMWNSTVEIVFPAQLDALDDDQVERLETASGSLTPSGHSGHFRLVNTGGSEVSFSTANAGVDDGSGDDATSTDTQTITIDVKAMDKKQGFEIIYYSKIPEVTDTQNSATTSAFSVNAATRGETTAVPLTAAVTGGLLRQKDGSGTMTVNPMYVEIDSGVKQFELQYKAATLLRNATLTITIPTELLGNDGDDAGTDPDYRLQDLDTGTTAIDGTIPIGKIGTGDDKRNSSAAGYVYAPDRRATSLAVGGTSGNIITWNELTLTTGQPFRTIVRLATEGTAVSTAGATFGDILDDAQTAPTGGRDDDAGDGIYPFYTTININAGETDGVLEGDSDADLYAIRGQNNDVTFKIWKPADAADTTIGDTELVNEVSYPAASVQDLTFRFEAAGTAIKDGTFSFRIPRSWDKPRAVDPDNVKPGETTSSIDFDGDGTVDADDGDGPLDKKKISADYTVTVTVDELPKGGYIDVVYSTATVQHNADTVDIIGEFKTFKNARSRRAGRVEVDITNVADGSGSATISTGTSPAYTVRAGSVDNTITVVYTAAGSMNGGNVSLGIPDSWGDMQADDSKAPNYVTVTARGGSLSSTPAYVGRRVAVANLNQFGMGDTVTFTYGAGSGDKKGAEAPSDVGVGAFVVSSDGGSDQTINPIPLAGDAEQPANAVDADLLGKIYWIDDNSDDKFTRANDTANGRLRIKVVSAADGTGVATFEVRNSSNFGRYDAGSTDMYEVHAGDDSVYLLFSYTPTQTIEDGELRFTVPGDWTIPQEDDQGEHGYTYLEEVRNAQIGTAVFTDNSRTVSVEIIEITKNDAIQIHYGWHGARDGGAEAPRTAGKTPFGFQIKGSTDGSLKPIRSVEVNVREQASGAGTAKIASARALHAGDMDNTITITYTAIGQIVNGALKLTIPKNWPLATSDNLKASSGSDPTFAEVKAADITEDQMAKVDQTVTVTGIRLEAGATVDLTYTTDVIKTKGSQTFKLAFQGGDGPDGSDDGTDPDFIALSDLNVTVGEAAAGSGTAAVMTDGDIRTDSPNEVITFTYTAPGQIDYPGEFAVRIPTEWGKPSANSYTVEYKDANGGALIGTSQSVEEIAPDGQNIRASIRGAASPTIAAGNQIVFIYTGNAPATAGPTNFTVFYDDNQVGDPLEVRVLSAEEASMVSVSVMGNLASGDAAIPVTVNLLASDGTTAATRNTALVVTLSSSAAGGMFSSGMGSTATFDSTLDLTFNPGQDEMMAYYKDANSHVATITATPAAASAIPAVTAKVDTDVLEVTSVTFAVTDSNDTAKAVAAAGDTVTVTAMATPGRTTTPTFSIGSDLTGRSMMESATAAGTYTGTWTVVVDQHDGTHPVSATLGTSTVSAATQLMVDTAKPVVAITAPAAGMTVANGATVNITATVTDATDVTVTADVSTLDSGAEADSVMLTDADADGTYEGMHTISTGNTKANGDYAIAVKATDAAGNMNDAVTVSVTLENSLSYTSTLPVGLSLFHVPLVEAGLDTVGDLKAKIGSGASFLIVRDHAEGRWNPRGDDMMITADLGIIVSMNAASEVTFEGHPWGTDGEAMISLKSGQNLIGLPLNDSRVTNISDISSLFGAGVVTTIVAASGGEFKPVSAGGADDGPVAGDAAYLVIASADGTATVTGAGWGNGSATGAAPIALAGYTADNQTPVLDVHGSVVDEITGLAKEGIRVKVKNLSTKAALSDISAIEEASDGYNITFVDLNDSHAARVGDVLEISADSPNPLIGIKSVRHIVTVDDVKNSRITLEALIAYEIPAETDLLRNYPNPFNPETWIPYHLSEDADVSLTIYDVNGALVRDIDVGHQTAAKYDTRSKAIYWDGRNQFGEQVASGIYFYSLSAGDFSATRKMVILK